MPTRKKLTDMQRWQINVRAKAGEQSTALGREFGVDESTIRKIKSQDTDLLFAKAGAPVKNDEQKLVEKPRVRIKAVTIRLTVEPKVEQAIAPVSHTEVVAVPKKDIPLAPLGKQVAPLDLKGLPRKLGKRQPTSDGAAIIINSDGKAVRIEQCPVYEKFQMIRRDNVDITKIDGVMVEGKITQWSGEEIHGHLVFDGVPGSGIISRVEFHPNTLPGQYELDREEFRRKLQ